MSWELGLLACIVLYSLPSRGSGALSECRIVDSFTSPYVTPWFKRNAIVSGCTSRERSSTSPVQEVHVVRIVGGELSSTSGRRKAKVTLHISPLKERGIFRDSLIFVLWSHQPVEWQIHSERISNTTRSQFYISRNARLAKDNRMHIKVRKQDLPNHTWDLKQWVRENYTVINSFIEVQNANLVLKKVGLDPSAPVRCEVASPFQSPTTIATRLQRSDMRGCARTQKVYNSRATDIHILVLKRNPPTYGPENVIIDIKTKKGIARNKNIVLVLKSDNRDIRWIILNGGVRGIIEIFANVAVDQVDSDRVTERQVQFSVSTDDHITDRHDKILLQWVLEKKGPASIVSYAETQRADRFELFVDGGVDPVRHKPPPRITPFDHPSRTRGAIKEAKSVTCGPNLMVALRKDILLPYGIRKEHLSLLDRDCHFVANDTHYLLTTNSRKCETTANDHDNMMTTLQNAVVVHRLDNEDDLSDDELEGSAILDHPLVGSGYLDDTHIDDEDFSESDTIRVEVSCTATVSTPRELPTLKYHLNLFADESFGKQITRFPYTPGEDQRVYVETRVEAVAPETGDVSDHNLQSVIINCSVSAFSEEGNVLRHAVITDACGVLQSLKWHENGPGNSQRFSFIHYHFSRNEVREYTMSCQLTICSYEQNYVLPGVEKCPSDKDYLCFTWKISRPGEAPVSRPTQTVQRGPIRLKGYVSRDCDEAGPELASPLPNEAYSTESNHQQQRNCQQVVRREGLDSGTVVGIAFAAFFIGVLLTAALWFIHTHTGPLRKSNRPRSTETSGESTPSSTAPITIHQIHT